MTNNLDAQVILEKKLADSRKNKPVAKDNAVGKAPKPCSQPVYSSPIAKAKWDVPRIGVLIGGILFVAGGIHTFLKRKAQAKDIGKS